MDAFPILTMDFAFDRFYFRHFSAPHYF